MTSTDIEPFTEEKKELAPLEESPALNRLLIRNARRSAIEIEAITGIPATEVAERLEYLLNNPSVRNDLMEEKLILAEIALVVQDIRDRMDGYVKDDEGFASMARVAIAAAKLQLDQLDKRRKNLTDKLKMVSEFEAGVMMGAVRMAREMAIIEMQERFPEADDEVVYEIIDGSFAKALEHLQENSE